MHRDLPCSKGMLVNTVLDICCPPSSSDVTTYSYEKKPTTTGPTCDDMHTLLLK
jgi:hypothetical protein